MLHVRVTGSLAVARWWMLIFTYVMADDFTKNQYEGPLEG